MFQIIMRLEESISSEKFDNNATYAPDVARKAPAKLQNDFWSTIVSCRYNRRMVFIVKSRRTKVDESDLAVQQDSPLSRIALSGVRGRRNIPVVGKCLVIVMHQ